MSDELSSVMPFTGSLSVGLCEGNETLRSLIAEVLSEASMSVKFMDASASLGQESVDLLVIDVDSGIAGARVELLLKVGRASQTPVLVLGLASSQDVYGAGLSGQELGWLERPFSGAQLVYHCRRLLGHGVESSVDFQGSADDEPPMFREGFGEDEPPTVEFDLGYPGMMDSEMGSPILDLDDFLSLGAEGLAGGVLVGSIRERRVEAAELEQEIEHLAEPTALLQLSASEGFLLSETLSEVSSSGEVSGLGLSEGSGEVVRDAGVSVVSRHRLGGGHSSVSALGLSPEIVHSITGTSRMLAESWDRLGLAARTEDRADRLERILFALFKDGLQGAASALSRIPHASGLSGSLQVLGLIDLLHMLRERRLRGRLELCAGAQVFVLYIDGGVLEDIESLGGSTDAILLRILREQAGIDEETYERLCAEEDDGLAAPLEMRLRIERLVDDADLRAARRLRARELFGGLFEERRGNYAFIEIPADSGQAWPVEGLRLNIDEMLLRVLREERSASEKLVSEKQGEWDADMGLVFDPVRAASVRSSALMDSERELLLFFQAGETLGEARRYFGNAGEDVDQIVRRLVRVELLKPHKVNARRVLNRRTVRPSSQVMLSQGLSGQESQESVLQESVLQESASRIELDFDLDEIVAPVHDPHQSPTAVSDWSIPIPGLLESSGSFLESDFPVDDALWEELDLFFERDDMSEVSGELLPETGDLGQRIFGSGAQDEES